MPPCVVAEAELAARAEHAVRPLAAHLAPADLQAVGHRRAEGGQRHEVADRHVERAAPRPAAARRRRRRRRRAGSCRRRDGAAGRSTRATTTPSTGSPTCDRSSSTARPRSLERRRRARRRRRRRARTRWSHDEAATLSSELLQEADVVGEHLAEVVDRRGASAARRSMPKPKAKPAPLLGVEAARRAARWGAPCRSRRARATEPSRAAGCRTRPTAR